MDVRVGKYCFNSDSLDLANKEAFLKAFPKKKGFDPAGFWKAYEAEKKRLDGLKSKQK